MQCGSGIEMPLSSPLAHFATGFHPERGKRLLDGQFPSMKSLVFRGTPHADSVSGDV
jgi:hypothetical protein